MISLVGEYGSLLRVRSEPTTTKCRARSSCSPAPISGPSPSHCLTRPAVSGSGCSPQSPRTTPAAVGAGDRCPRVRTAPTVGSRPRRHAPGVLSCPGPATDKSPAPDFRAQPAHPALAEAPLPQPGTGGPSPPERPVRGGAGTEPVDDSGNRKTVRARYSRCSRSATSSSVRSAMFSGCGRRPIPSPEMIRTRSQRDPRFPTTTRNSGSTRPGCRVRCSAGTASTPRPPHRN